MVGMSADRIGRYDEIVKEHEVTYVAGGAAQNAARGAAVRGRVVFCDGLC